MKSLLEVCLLVIAIPCVLGAQDSSKPVLHHGMRVEMPVASHAVEMRAADTEDATVVALTADGKLFLGVQPLEVSDLSNLTAGVVYVKADARVQYQKILTVLDALHGRPVVLLTAPVSNVERDKVAPPYGVKVTVGV